jgi:hypothetical protein
VPFYLTPIIASATMLTHYSRLYPVNTAKLAKVTALSNPVTTIPTKALVLSDFSCTVGLVFVDTFGIIQFLANPVISNVTATTLVISTMLRQSSPSSLLVTWPRNSIFVLGLCAPPRWMLQILLYHRQTSQNSVLLMSPTEPEMHLSSPSSTPSCHGLWVSHHQQVIF